jgi:hypothetical protein
VRDEATQNSTLKRKRFVVLAQKVFTKDRGWPVPSKFAHIYENLLGHCPYQMFFDTESLCNSDNEKNVTKLLAMQGQEATDFFNAHSVEAAKLD